MLDAEFIVAVSPFRRALNFALTARSRWSTEAPDALLEKARRGLERYGATHEIACLAEAVCALLTGLAKILKSKKEDAGP